MASGSVPGRPSCPPRISGKTWTQTTRGSVCDSHYHFFCCFRISKIHQLAQIFSENSELKKKCFDFQELSRISCNPVKFSAKKHVIWGDFQSNLQNSGKITENLQNLRKFVKNWDRNGAKECQSCRSRKMLKNGYLLAKIGADTAENEPLNVRRSQILQITV